MYKKTLVVWGLLFSVSLFGATKMENRMKLLQQLDMLDALDFQEEIEAAGNCIEKRDFNCAQQHITSAENLSNAKDQSQLLATVRQSLKNEQYQVRLEKEEARERRIAERERERQRKIAAEQERAYQREMARLQRQANQQPSQSTAAMFIDALDKVNADLQASNAQAQKNLQRQIEQANRNYRQAQKNQQRQQQAYQAKQREAQAQREQQRQNYARQQQALAKQRSAQLAQISKPAKPVEQKKSPKKEKYQLVVEALAFCWQHQSKEDHWRCRGPRHVKSVKGDSITLYGEGLLAQAENAGCSGASNRNKQAFSAGDKSGYILYCQKSLKEYDADLAADYNVPRRIRVQRNVYKCNYPIQNGCEVYKRQSGDVANRQVFQ